MIWTTSLRKTFEARKAAAMSVPRERQKPLTGPDIIHLPPPVRKYIAVTGSIGRPLVTDITMHFNATMFDVPARVTFSLGGNIVSAELVFNVAGELVDFVSDDRGMLDKDGSLRILRWSTPFGDYQTFDGRRVASEGNAIWHLPEAPFTYGHMRLTQYEAR